MENRKTESNPKSDREISAAKESARDEVETIPMGEESVDSEEIEEANEEDHDSRTRNSRTPFTSLSQVDADLALARTLQEQERAYMMLSMGRRRYGNSRNLSESEVQDEEGEDEENHSGNENSVDDENYDEDAFDAQVSAADIDPSAFDDDEAYARALQEAETRELASQFMNFNGIREWVVEDPGDGSSSTHDTWSDVDPDELSYEELIALGEAVGTESRGLTYERIASLPSVSYKASGSNEGRNDQCVICQLDYEENDNLVVLSCKHMYHPDCINSWLQINKVCPICNIEVSTPEERESKDE